MYLSLEQLGTTSPYIPVQVPDVQILHEQGSGDNNEDTLLCEDGLYGVFDGATSLSEKRYSGGRTGGRIAAELAAATFRNNDLDLRNQVIEANNRIRQAQQQKQDISTKRHNLWSTSLAVARISGEQLEYCSLGDATILVLTGDGNYQVLTPEIDIDRTTLIMWKACQGKTGTIYELLSEQIRKVRNRMNIDYGVLNGEPEAVQFIESGTIPLTNVTDIVLFTDGLFLPRTNPEEDHDWDFFVKLYKDGGLQKTRDYVRKLQCDDPENRLYPRFKTHDDIAAVAVSF